MYRPADALGQSRSSHRAYCWIFFMPSSGSSFHAALNVARALSC
jgi:hypothetical protein